MATVWIDVSTLDSEFIFVQNTTPCSYV